MNDDQPLFSNGHLDASLRKAEEDLKAEIERYSSNSLLNTPLEDLCAYFAQKSRFAQVELREADISVEQQETTLDTNRISNGRWLFGNHQRTVPGTLFKFFVPSSGNPYC